MRRGGPLRRLAPLVRRSPLAAGTTPLRRSPLKRTRARGVPSEVRAAVLARDGGCRAAALVGEVRCWGPLDPHHLRRRSQGGTDTAANLATVCRAHHDWIHAHPEAASVLGLLHLSRPTTTTQGDHDHE